MATPFKVQASAVAFETLGPPGWGFAFGVHVTDQAGVPVAGLQKSNFRVFDMNAFHAVDLADFNEIGATFPATEIRGIYRLQTIDVLPEGAPQPQEYLFAIEVRAAAAGSRGTPDRGETTVAVTYLGKYH